MSLGPVGIRAAVSQSPFFTLCQFSRSGLRDLDVFLSRFTDLAAREDRHTRHRMQISSRRQIEDKEMKRNRAAEDEKYHTNLANRVQEDKQRREKQTIEDEYLEIIKKALNAQEKLNKRHQPQKTNLSGSQSPPLNHYDEHDRSRSRSPNTTQASSRPATPVGWILESFGGPASQDDLAFVGTDKSSCPAVFSINMMASSSSIREVRYWKIESLHVKTSPAETARREVPDPGSPTLPRHILPSECFAFSITTALTTTLTLRL